MIIWKNQAFPLELTVFLVSWDWPSLRNWLMRIGVIPAGWKVYKLGCFAPQQNEGILSEGCEWIPQVGEPQAVLTVDGAPEPLPCFWTGVWASVVFGLIWGGLFPWLPRMVPWSFRFCLLWDLRDPVVWNQWAEEGGAFLLPSWLPEPQGSFFETNL